MDDQYVYLFWHHEEDGPIGLKATLNRSKVLDVAKSYNTEGWFARADKLSEVGVIDKLTAYLDITDEQLSTKDAEGIWSLMAGWGGLHFQVVKLA